MLQPSSKNPSSSSDDELYNVVDEANKIHAEKPVDLFISYHVNAGGGSGFESFVARNASAESIRCRDVIHDKVAMYFSKNGMSDRGKKVADYVIAETYMPAVLLECETLHLSMG